ncbi:MAG: glycosyltransferase [Patescibacteria group bacterium]
MITVAHLISEYLITNHTYVYDHLVGHDDGYRMVVISRCLFPAREKFPFSPVYGLIPWYRLYPYLNQYVPWLVDWVADKYFKYWIKKEDADILHAHFGNFGAKLMGVKKDVDLPMVVSFYGDDAASYPQKPEWKELYQKMFREVEVFIAICEDMKKKLVSFGCPEEKIKIIHVATDLEKFSYQAREIGGKGSEDNPVNFLMVATFNKKKGHSTLIDAFKNVYERNNNVTLTLVGFGPLKGDIEKQIAEYGLEEQVEIVDTTDHPDFFSLFVDQLHSKDVFVHPSQTTEEGSSEGTPTVIMAASAAGMPVVSTQHAGIPEIVVDGETGFLVPERDDSALAEKMLYLAENPDLWNQMGKAGRERMENEFSQSVLIEKLEKIYDTLLEK